ncbi:hypothetical protein PGTUg99_024136 [Puccinia graminis f. sp. tritici]|uniref:Uncharacterized protein n=1 Tax=Puccinia graminis f. sp. tritici TaxID=56615 RepID=A0A5B0S095_PUCGR|nr:hypothetical protein PGTUg99_024136 [Puccinia graminis f. sp. tritici]
MCINLGRIRCDFLVFSWLLPQLRVPRTPYGHTQLNKATRTEVRGNRSHILSRNTELSLASSSADYAFRFRIVHACHWVIEARVWKFTASVRFPYFFLASTPAPCNEDPIRPYPSLTKPLERSVRGTRAEISHPQP